MEILRRLKDWMGLGGNLQLYESEPLLAGRPWDADTQRALDLLVEGARDAGQVIRVWHLLRALCPQLPLEQAYGAARAARFVSLVDEEVLRSHVAVPEGYESVVDQDVAWLLEMACQSVRKDDEQVTSKRLLGLVLSWPAQPKKALAEAEFELMPLLRWAAHDTLSVNNSWHEDESDDETYELYLLNDAITTQAFVTTLLESHLLLHGSDAETRMREIHEEGEGLLAVGDFELVSGIAESIQRDARAAGYPLEVQVRHPA